MKQRETRVQAWPSVRRIAAKEIAIFFASPIAYLFLGTFAAVTLFVFFWGEAFFARNIADVRPLFEWMPILLIFLASTLTMRLWSEERRSGTLEYVHAQPVPLWFFVLGKYLACLALLTLALLITLPLPITVSLIGDLDWGPVWAGYLATLLLGGAYLSMGLFVSARSDNQIVSLISATALCGVFYLVGTAIITDFFGTRAGEWLRLLGTGARFESITRGVIDVRDLYYYVSLVALFLVLNIYVLERERWAPAARNASHRGVAITAALLVANALAGNLWLGQLHTLRADVTEGRQYSISDATYRYIDQLREPLLIRGYFSAQTHPLLAPLVPQLEDLLREYEVAGGKRIRVEVVDPAVHPELEEDANRNYGIHPVPFQVADRYQASIVSSYFNILVQYGDEHRVLGFEDLVEIRAGSESAVEVQLRNPEYDLTRTIKGVVSAYQAGGNLFDTVTGELAFTAYVSAEDRLPESLRDFRDQVAAVVEEVARESRGSMQVEFIDPQADGGVTSARIAEEFGFQPMTTSLFSDDYFYFYFVLSDGDSVIQIPLEEMTEGSFRRNLEAGIKRFARGFTKTVGMVMPVVDPMYAQYSPPAGGFSQVRSFLESEFNVVEENLADGQVSGEIDVLLLLAPAIADDRQLFAVDQFLMQGGTVIVASSPFKARLLGRNLEMQRHDSGLDGWLSHHGLAIGEQLVLDPQNAAFPLPVTRDVGGFQVQELMMIDYPYFIDIRREGMHVDNAITAELPQVSMAWASPIEVASDANAERRLTELLRSSSGAWLSDTTQVIPRVDAGGVSRFLPEGDTGSRLLGVISEGRFDSYFANRQSPLLPQEEETRGSDDAGSVPAEGRQAEPAEEVIGSVIERSPESARIILFSSNDFLQDMVIGMAGALTGAEYLNSLQLLANTVDWTLEDRALLNIRARGHFNRTLPPLDQGSQVFWEYLNYVLAAIAIGLVAFARHRRQSRRLNAFSEYAQVQEA